MTCRCIFCCNFKRMFCLRFCEQGVESLHHGSCDLENFAGDLCAFLHVIFAYLPVVKILGLAVLFKEWMENLTGRESRFRLKRKGR